MVERFCTSLYKATTPAEIVSSYRDIQESFGNETVVNRFLTASPSIADKLLVRTLLISVLQSCRSEEVRRKRIKSNILF